MSNWFIFLSIALSVHLGVAIGTMIKFRNDLNMVNAVKFLVLLPLQVLFVSVVSFCKVTWECMKEIKTWRKKVRMFFESASVCINFSPIVASLIAKSMLSSKTRFSKAWRTVRNQSVGAIAYALQH
jgi:hypothetical protein